jgi:AhpD family alkylhydroperoxidase
MQELPERAEPSDDLLRGRVVRAVRQAIAEGVLAPGRRLTERELIELTGVSRTSVREALRHLQTLGLVEPGPNKRSGLRVAVLDEDAVRHIYEVRAALEPVATGLFVERAPEEEVEALLALGEHLPSVRSERLDSILRIDRMVIGGARNPVLAATLDPLLMRIHALRHVSMAIPGRAAASDREYKAIFTAIRARQPEWARDASRRHVVAAGKAAVEAVKMLQPASRLSALMGPDPAGPPPPEGPPPSSLSRPIKEPSVAEHTAPSDPYAAVPKLRELREKVLFGDIWEREELSKRDRSLITVAVLVAERCTDELRAHIARALQNGVTESEISELITHVAFYAGWPAGVNGSRMATAVFEAHAGGGKS